MATAVQDSDFQGKGEGGGDMDDKDIKLTELTHAGG